MKKIIILLAFIIFTYGASGPVEVAQFPLTTGQPHSIQTDIQFTSDFFIYPDIPSGGAAVGEIDDGDTVCQNLDIDIETDVNGRWPLNTNSFNVLSEFPQCPAANPNCNNPDPPAYNTITTNEPVTWIRAADFDIVRQFQASRQATPNPRIQTFYTQKADYDKLFATPGPEFTNREAGVGVYCKGNARITQRRPDGTMIVLFDGDVGDLVDQNVMLSQIGQHNFQTTLSNVQCFGVVEKRPTSPLYQIYIFKASIYSPSSQQITERKTLDVRAPSGLLSMSLVQPPSGTTFTLGSTNRVTVQFDIRNSGSLPFEIRTVSATSPFTGTKHTNPCIQGDTAACNLARALGINYPSENGFDKRIDAGQSQTMYVDVQTSGACGQPTTLSLGYQALDSSICSQRPSGTFNVQYNIACAPGSNTNTTNTTNQTIQCRYNEDCTNRQFCYYQRPTDPGGVCMRFRNNVQPDSQTVGTDSEVFLYNECTATPQGQAEFQYSCDNIVARSRTPTNGFAWSQPNNPNFVPIRADYTDNDDFEGWTPTTTGIALVTADYRGVTDTGTISVVYNGPGIELTPDLAIKYQNEAQDFDLACFSRIYDRTTFPCTGTAWSTTGVPIVLTTTDTRAAAQATLATGWANVTAQVNYQGTTYTDSSALYVLPAAAICDINPNGAGPNTVAPFTVSCSRSGVAENCAPTTWRVGGNAQQQSISPDTHTITLQTGNQGTVTLDANANEVVCSLTFDLANSTNQQICSITPVSTGPNDVEPFTVNCSRSGVTEACVPTVWAVSGNAQQQSISPDTHTITLQTGNQGTVTLDAVSNQTSCNINFSLSNQNQKICNINPTSTGPGTTTPFTVSCLRNGVSENCGTTIWTVGGNAQQQSISPDTHTITLQTGNQGTVTLDANEGEAACSINFDVNFTITDCAPNCPDSNEVDHDCTINGPDIIKPGNTYTYRLTCDAGTCQGATWALSPLSAFTIERRNRNPDFITVRVNANALTGLTELDALVYAHGPGATTNYQCTRRPTIQNYDCRDLT